MTIARVNSAWQNWPGAPGVTTFYASPTPLQADIDSVRAFFFALAGLLPTGLTIQVPSSGDNIDETDGTITGTWSVGVTPAVVTGTGAGAYAGNAGAVVHWLSNGIVAGRRVRGRSFIVPIISSSYDTAGSLSAATITTLTNAATALESSAFPMTVWARPFVHPTTPALNRAGSQHQVASIRVPDLAVSLRSRRI